MSRIASASAATIIAAKWLLLIFVSTILKTSHMFSLILTTTLTEQLKDNSTV